MAIAGTSTGARPQWKAGVGKVRITPRKNIWMSGFGARTKAAEGVLHDLYAKALALEDGSGRRAVVVSADILGFPAPVANRIAQAAGKHYGLGRDRLMLNASHTHCGPALATPRRAVLSAMAGDADWRDIEAYTREFEVHVLGAIGQAIRALRPARISFGHGHTEFAVNRRRKTDKGVVSFRPNPEGPVDHDVPVLRVDSERGSLEAVVFGYACHTSSIFDDNYLFNGDYAGFAQIALESRHPGTVAMFIQGCGGDITCHPRGTVEYAQRYGGMLAAAAEDALAGKTAEVAGPLKSHFEHVDIEFVPASRAELEAWLKHKNPIRQRYGKVMLEILDTQGHLQAQYPYPLQVWQFGRDLTWVAMAGEVVVDYALRLKREFGPDRLWVAGYSNDVFAYIPSRRVLEEGGYEGGESMTFYMQPGPFAPSIEGVLLRSIRAALRGVK